MKNHFLNFDDIYSAPGRPMMIDGAALPRWTPPLTPEYYYRKARSLPVEDMSKPVLIPVHLHGTEAVGELFHYTVRVMTDIDMSSDPDLETLDLDSIVGTEVTVSIDVPGKGTFVPGMAGDTGRGNIGFHVRRISGYVSVARFVRRDDRSVVYEFEIEPALKKATLGQNWRIFQNCTVIEAISELLRGYAAKIDWRIAGPIHGSHYPRRDLQRQYYESDYICFKRWCERAGLFFWFDHDDAHTIVIADTMGAFHRHGEAYRTIRYAPDENRTDEETIARLEFASRQTAGNATGVDHDYTEPRMRRANIPLRVSSEDPRDTARADQEFYEYVNTSQPLQGAMGLNAEPLDADEQARQAAMVRMQSLRCQGLRATGHGHLRALIPGKTFHLAEHPLDKANQEYIVVSTTLTMEANAQASGTAQAFRCDTAFELCPVLAGYFRLPIVTPWPVAGTEIAIVSGPDDQQLWTDALGRVKCQLVPDRAGRYDENSFIWLRVTQPWQNGQMGAALVPRIRSEILVGYINGNPDMPYIAGSAVNADNPPAWALPHNRWVSGLRSRMEKGSSSNHLALDDTHGRQQAQLASDHAKSSLSLGYITRIDGNRGRQDERGEGFELRTDKHGALRAALGMIVTTFARTGAAGKVKEMGETHAQLTEARSIHEELALSAQQHGAQQATGAQRDVAKALSDANAALRGRASDGARDFPEFGQPDIAVSSAANLHAAAQDNTHIVSGKHTALTAGGNVAIAALKSLFASVREAIAFYASKSITMIAATGRIHLEARTDALQAIAREDVTVTSQNGWLRLAALKGIEINAGGTLLRLTPQGVTVHTNGHYLVHAASHATDDPQAAPVMLPVTQENPGRLAAHHVLVEDGGGFILGGQPYRITLDDGQVIEGVTNGRGEMQVATSNAVSFGLVELMSQSEPDKVMSASTTTVWRDDSLSTPETVEMPEKRTTKVGGKSAETPGDGLTGDGKPPVFVGCDPMNWGLRTCHLLRNAKAADTPPAFQYRSDIEYPVAKSYTAAVKESLCRIEWASLAGKTDEDLAAVIVPAIQGPIWNALQAGPFGLPGPTSASAMAMPDIVIVSAANAAQYDFPIGAHGIFTARYWTLCLSRWDVDQIITTMKGDPSTNAVLIDFADTVYHEARHCQQLFWQIALLGAFPDDYREFSGMEECFRRIAGAKIFDLAFDTPFPHDSLARAGIHAMLIFYYYWVITKTKGIADWQFIQADQNKVETEVCKVRNVTPERARTMAVTYTSYLHEQDAFLCGEVVQYCWTGRSQLRNPGTCTSVYAHVIQSIRAR
ncbi:type VI secretion system Vgr family protein [Paraburkholderia strydomiana]|uniref:Type VI secretion system tip protein TssI/VgrG n=3 Tax=Paraburkholderia TaxID=1822464 RepID=A0ABW9CEC1_9BURK